MPRPPGTPKTGGRKAGTPNKRTQDLQDRLSELECDPIEGMVNIASTAKTDGNLMLAGQMYKELAQYVYPKRRASDTPEEPLDEVTNVTIRYVDARKKRKLKKEGS